MVHGLSYTTKKNILDLHFTKNLQYYTTSIIILFTYVIGVVIAFLTGQVSVQNINQLLLVGVISSVVISIITLLMLTFRSHLKEIPELIKSLEI